MLWWCLVRHLDPVNKTLAKVRNVDREFGKQLNFKRVKSPVNKKDYVKIWKQNNISISVLGCGNKNQWWMQAV